MVFGALLLPVAVALQLFRQRGVPSWNTIWAEDGTYYFGESHRDGALRVLLREHAGYLQLPPRLLGALASTLPLRDLAWFSALSGAIVAAVLAGFLYWAAAGWIESRAMRVALAALVVLMPVLGFENTANMTNTIWLFTAVAPWAIIARRHSPIAVVARGAVVFLAATSTPLVALYLPLVVGYALVRRRKDASLVAGAYGAGLIVQLVVVMNAPDSHAATGGSDAPRLLGLLNVRVFAEYLIGERGISALWSDYRGPLIIVAPLLVAGLFTALLIGIERSRVVVACTLFVTAVTMFAVPVLGRGTNAISVSEGEQNVFLRRLSGFMLASPGADAYSSVGLRFSVVPVLLVASAFAITISSKRRASRPTGTLLRALFVAHVAVLVVVGFSVSNPRSNGPGWHDELAHAAARDCANAPPDAPVRVETPMWLFPVEVTCDDLVGVEP